MLHCDHRILGLTLSARHKLTFLRRRKLFYKCGARNRLQCTRARDRFWWWMHGVQYDVCDLCVRVAWPTNSSCTHRVWAVRCEITDYNMCATLVYSVFNNYITSWVIRLWVGRSKWFASSREYEKSKKVFKEKWFGLTLARNKNIYTHSRYVLTQRTGKWKWSFELN